MLQPIPREATARRLEWHVLPPALRSLVARRLGSEVVHADSHGSGFTPGLASTLTCADGRRWFVKAASATAQRAFAAAYTAQARATAVLPAGTPAPRAAWWHRHDDWVVLVTEHVPGAAPGGPWAPSDLDACLDALETLADLGDPAPAVVGETYADAASPHSWAHVLRTGPDDVEGLLTHAADAARLAAHGADVVGGDTLVHTDLLDDNVLVGDLGEVWLCDWKFPVRGAAWIDTVTLLVGASADVEADAVLRERPLTRDVPADDVDGLLALLAGHHLEARDRPVPPASPWLRAHQDRCAQLAWTWLAHRRAWRG